MSSSFLVSVSRLGLFPPCGGVLGPLFMLLGLIFLNLDLIGSEDAGLWDLQVHVLTPELRGTKPLSRHPWKPRSCCHFPLTFWHYHHKQHEDSQAGMGSHG